jgi:inner membrane protein
LLGYVVLHFYKQPWQKWVAISSWSILLLAVGLSLLLLGSFSIAKTIIALLILAIGAYFIYKRYFKDIYSPPDATVRQWQWLFLLALVTHPILDCFTTYGTQILLPFSNMRVAFNNIAVADPAYTLPFLICLLAAALYPKTHHRRQYWITAGLLVSSLYMAFTIFNKTRVNTIFENSLAKENITYSRYMTSPTILNNILWSGIAETDTSYVYGLYSFFDAEKSFKLNTVSKNRNPLEKDLENDPTLKTLRWFSNDYYLFKKVDGSKYGYYDLRFGTFRMKASDKEEFVFKFNLEKNQNSEYILKDQGERPSDGNFAEIFQLLWDRVMGRV